jgi:predicted ATP-grasp superfamily ATP-dependent carboligase
LRNLGSYVERLKAELSASYATNREFGRQLQEEKEKNEKLNAELKIAMLENGKLVELSRSQKEQADQLGQILEAIAVWVEKGMCPLRSPELIDGDDDLGQVATDDRAA